MKITLPNKMVLEHDDINELRKAAQAMGYTVDTTGFYYSDTHNTWMEIKEMHTSHIRNAMLKQVREWASRLSQLSDKELIAALREGVTDSGFTGLLREYITRMSKY